MLASLPGHAGDVQHLAWSADGAWLASGDDHGNLLGVAAGPRARARLTELALRAIDTVAFPTRPRLVAAGDHAGHVWLWSTRHVARAHEPRRGGDPAVVWTDGATRRAVDVDGAVHTWHVARDRARRSTSTVATGCRTKRALFAHAALGRARRRGRRA